MATFPGFDGYGGATITRVVDGAGAEWVGCCARDGAGKFGFRVFRNGVNVPIAPFCSGRGSISADGRWIAWEGSRHFSGPIPGFAPIVLTSGATRPPVAIPVGGAIDELWDGVYAAKDFDTAAETALRVQKQLDAIQEIVELLKKAGVLV